MKIKKASDRNFGHVLETILTLSAEALSKRSELVPLLIDGMPTPLFETPIVVLVIIRRREGEESSASLPGAAAGAAGGAGGAAAGVG